MGIRVVLVIMLFKRLNTANASEHFQNIDGVTGAEKNHHFLLVQKALLCVGALHGFVWNRARAHSERAAQTGASRCGIVFFYSK